MLVILSLACALSQTPSSAKTGVGPFESAQPAVTRLPATKLSSILRPGYRIEDVTSQVGMCDLGVSHGIVLIGPDGIRHPFTRIEDLEGRAEIQSTEDALKFVRIRTDWSHFRSFRPLWAEIRPVSRVTQTDFSNKIAYDVVTDIVSHHTVSFGGVVPDWFASEVSWSPPQTSVAKEPEGIVYYVERFVVTEPGPMEFPCALHRVTEKVCANGKYEIVDDVVLPEGKKLDWVVTMFHD